MQGLALTRLERDEMVTPEDARWMRRALELARAMVGVASPNPMVGCVLVRDGEAIGEGAHRYDRFDHAEIAALKDAAARGQEIAGATAYVTLEPCSHHGRTGPCADALIAARVERVVAATVDPNPRVSGRGIERMRAAGIAVEVGVCEAEARELNGGFATWIRTNRPLVTLKAALSADGMLGPPVASRVPGETFWITGDAARAEVQQMRHASDAVLTGIGTVLADNPMLTDRSGGERRRLLQRVILDAQLQTPVESKLVQTAAGDVTVFCGMSAPAERDAALGQAGVEVVRVPDTDGRMDLCAVLDALGRRQVLNLLLECGSRLNGAFLRAGLVDRLVLFYARRELGVGSVPFAEGVGAPGLVEEELRGVTRGVAGDDVWLRGELRNAWGNPVGAQVELAE